MKTIIILYLLLVSSFSWAAGPDRVYFFDGFFVRLSVESFETAVAKVKDHVDKNHPGTEFYAIHNSKSGSVCEELKKLKEDEFPRKLVLIGHSYGAGAATSISKCLGERKVDLVIAIDSVQRIQDTFGATIPDNVEKAYNFYEDQDFALRGKQKYTRSNYQNLTGIENEKIATEGPSPHYNIVTQLTESGRIQNLVSEVLADKKSSAPIADNITTDNPTPADSNETKLIPEESAGKVSTDATNGSY